MGLEESLLAPTEIASSSEYELESKVNTTSSPLLIYTLSSSTLPLLSPSPIDSPPSYYTMSQ